ncbi:hypothetical protein PLANPX_2794 [Lacipirellula parvula]|uniref:Uncharacterized protein n=1 Tax=Lacipirellula parvula TaxID=2650471 RepID=A0A5K7XB62_9BACT|nr:hypothetical protein PLANPX_2794 [Lacipirellula parvula]
MRFNLKLVLFVVMPVVALLASWLGRDEIALAVSVRLVLPVLACCVVWWGVCRLLSLSTQSDAERDESNNERSLP